MPPGAEAHRRARRIPTGAQSLDLAGLGQQRLRFAKQRVARAREHRLRAAAPNEEALAQMFLQRRDMRGDRCLRDAEAVRRPDEVTILGRLNEDLELTQRAWNHRE